VFSQSKNEWSLKCRECVEFVTSWSETIQRWTFFARTDICPSSVENTSLSSGLVPIRSPELLMQ
jgi:hypothetical protein